MHTMARSFIRLFAALALAAGASTAMAGEAGLVRDAGGHFRTPVMIGDKGPYDFVVDTGAATTVVMERLVDELHVAPVLGGGIRIQGASGSAAVSRYRFQDVGNGTFRADQLVAPMIPNAGASTAYGVLGMDRFAGGRIELDFAGGKFRTGASGPTPAGFSAVPVTLRRGSFAILTVMVDGALTKAVIDTGARRTTGNAALMKALGYTDADPRLAEARPIQGATTDRTAAKKTHFQRLDVGSVAFGPGELTFADLPVMKLFADPDEPMLILGIDVLSHASALAIDYPRSELQLGAVKL